MSKKRELTTLARGLRRQQAIAERNLWARLRNKQIKGVKFRRQQFIGPYIVDFVSLERKLVIEIDGSQHNEEETRETDKKRTTWLKETGYQVIRFWDNAILTDINGVLQRIREALV